MSRQLPPLAILPLPTLTDSLPTLNAKLSSYIHVLATGSSLAAATAYHAVPPQHSSSNTTSSAPLTSPEDEADTPHAKATREMTPLELDAFTAWSEGTVTALPEIDWSGIPDTSSPQTHKHTHSQPHTETTAETQAETNTQPQPQTTTASQRSQKQSQRRAEALNRLYDTDKAQARHWAWFATEHAALVPLVKAIGRVIGAEKDMAERARHMRAKPAGTLAREEAELRALERVLDEAKPVLVLSTEHGAEREEAEVKFAALGESRAGMRRRLGYAEDGLVPGKRKERP